MAKSKRSNIKPITNNDREKQTFKSIQTIEDVGFDEVDEYNNTRLQSIKVHKDKKQKEFYSSESEILDLESSDNENNEEESWGPNKKTYYEKLNKEEKMSDMEEEELVNELENRRLNKMKEQDFTNNMYDNKVNKHIIGIEDQSEDEEELLNYLDEKINKTECNDEPLDSGAFLDEEDETTELLEQLKEKYKLAVELLKSKETNNSDRLKYELCLAYITNISYYVYLKTTNHNQLENHPVIDVLVKMGELLQQHDTHNINHQPSCPVKDQEKVAGNSSSEADSDYENTADNDIEEMSVVSSSDLSDEAAVICEAPSKIETNEDLDFDLNLTNFDYAPNKKVPKVQNMSNNHANEESDQDLSSSDEIVDEETQQDNKKKQTNKRMLNAETIPYNNNANAETKPKDTNNGRRLATQKILKNRGLSNNNSKTNQNPKTKKREKFKKAIKKLGEKGKQYYGSGNNNQKSFYTGETNYINKNVSRSTKL